MEISSFQVSLPKDPKGKCLSPDPPWPCRLHQWCLQLQTLISGHCRGHFFDLGCWSWLVMAGPLETVIFKLIRSGSVLTNHYILQAEISTRKHSVESRTCLYTIQYSFFIDHLLVFGFLMVSTSQPQHFMVNWALKRLKTSPCKIFAEPMDQRCSLISRIMPHQLASQLKSTCQAPSYHLTISPATLPATLPAIPNHLQPQLSKLTNQLTLRSAPTLAMIISGVTESTFSAGLGCGSNPPGGSWHRSPLLEALYKGLAWTGLAPWLRTFAYSNCWDNKKPNSCSWVAPGYGFSMVFWWVAGYR